MCISLYTTLKKIQVLLWEMSEINMVKEIKQQVQNLFSCRRLRVSSVAVYQKVQEKVAYYEMCDDDTGEDTRRRIMIPLDVCQYVARLLHIITVKVLVKGYF